MKIRTILSKARLIALMVVSMWGSAAIATHGMGADITYQCLAPNQYQVTLTFFRDCAGITPATTEYLTITSVTCGVSTNLVLSQVGTAVDVTPLCPSLVSACVGGAGASNFGIEQYTYRGLLMLPAGCGNDWELGWKNCCRNFAISTLNGPGNQSMYVGAQLDNTVTPCNSSPLFTNIPTPIVCVNQPVIYNHGITDPDGDSLVFSLGPCQQDFGLPVSYSAGFSATTPLLSSTGVTIDPLTGSINFTPNQLQIGVICVLVEEYRNGVKIGETMRDMQFSVTNCSNIPPVASGVNGNAGVFDLDFCVGANNCFDILMTDVDLDNISASWNQAIPGGTFTVNNNGGQSPTGTFCWTPTTADVGAHFFTVTVQDDNCPLQGAATYAFTINVVPSIYSITVSPDASICQGQSIGLSASAPGASSYTWTPGIGLNTTTGSAVTANPLVPTIYSVSAVFPDGCGAQASVTVTPSQGPVLSVTPPVAYICPGNSIGITASSATATGYAWSNAAVGASINVTPAVSTTYTVTATDAQGCTSDADVVVNVNTPGTNSCDVLYASPGASGVGTAADPADLVTALGMAACNDVLIKLDVGTYTLDQPITNITGNLTIEGGYLQASGWEKTSQAGATTIHRSSINPEGAANEQRLVAMDISNASSFRIQDITITTANANLAGMSTYGVHLSNCSDYEFVRVQILPGDAADGVDGINGGNGANGENGQNGEQGRDNDQNDPGDGGNGGDGGGDDAINGIGGPGGSDANGPFACCLAGAPGGLGVNGNAIRMAGGGGGGGGGGEADNDGGDGAAGGNGGGGAVGGAEGAGGAWGNPGGDGVDGIDGAIGNDGATGANGGTPSNATGYFVPGTAGVDGVDGGGGAGGGGSGGGGGQDGFLVNRGAGGGGGSGGGGGEGGTAGTGGTAGGGSFAIFAHLNGANSSFDDCFFAAGMVGLGGTGGTGGAGGTGATGGFGLLTVLLEVGFGGVGGDGGDGGNGGNGGDAMDGIASTFLLNSGTPPNPFDINFNLAAQPVIQAGNVSCTDVSVNFSAATSGSWNFGASATPQITTGAAVSTAFSTTGRKTVSFNGQTYTGFMNVQQAGAEVPLATTNATLVSGVYRICEGSTIDFAALNGGTGYVYHWDFDGGTTPATAVGNAFSTVNNLTFNVADTFFIELQYQTDCCGMSVPDTIMLIVDPIPALVVTPDLAVCSGAGQVALSATGGSQYLWSPANGLSATSGTSVMANPTSTIQYTITSINEGGNCFDTSSVVITVNDLQLAPNVTDAACTPNGNVTLAVSGGSGSYQYAWAGYPGSTGNSLSNLSPGQVTVTVTDAITGCQDSTDAYIAQTPGTLTSYFATTQEVTCNGGTDGSAMLSVTGNTNPVSYVWTPNVSTTSLATGIPAGTYQVTITEFGTGCESFSTVTIPEPVEVELTLLDLVAPDCNTYATATANASGGNGPYSYTWNTTPIQTTQAVTGLEAQTYKVAVMDQDGCVDSLDVVVPGPQSPVTASLVSSTDASSCASTDGSITIQAAGSGGALFYAWSTSPVQNAPTANNLAPGPYTVTVTGSNGCAETIGVTIGPACVLSATDWLLAGSPDDGGYLLNWNLPEATRLSTLGLYRKTATNEFELIHSMRSSQLGGAFLDETITPGISHYYRLEGTDGEGRRHLSNIIEGTVTLESSWLLVKNYPNPVETDINTEVWSKEGGKLVCELYNTEGRLVATFLRELLPGKNIFQFDCESLASGFYSLNFRALGEPPVHFSVIKL